MEIQNLKVAYKKVCTAERLLNEVKTLVCENGGIEDRMYIVHNAIRVVDNLAANIKQVYTDTIEED